MPVRTLLFDLDDTLLGNSLDTFLPAYITSLAAHLAGTLRVPPQTLANELVAGAQAMFANVDPGRTLEQAFADHFYPATHLQPESVLPRIESYYADEFGALRSGTTEIPEARAMMQWAFHSGLEVAIATNAFFPRSAVLQRLHWAGIGIGEFPYSLVTTYEFMHFAKPRPEYFAETLTWLDRRADEALVIGNDWSQDMAPAQAIGLNSYWIAPRTAQPPSEDYSLLAGQGTLADFFKWARDSNCLDSLPAHPATPRAVRAQQAASLAVLQTVAAGLTEKQWRRRPADDEWSATEIMCHLRDVEVEVNQPRLIRIVADSNPFISAVDSDPWAVERHYQTQSGPEALAAFADARRATLSMLDLLSPADWERPARHAIFGPTTAQELLTFTNEHDRLHLRQMRENLKPEVGG